MPPNIAKQWMSKTTVEQNDHKAGYSRRGGKDSGHKVRLFHNPRRIRLGVRLLPLVFAGASLVACGLLTPRQPGEVVVAAYSAANAGHYEEADQYFTSTVKQFESQDGGSKVVWDTHTRGRRIQSLRVKDTTIKGDSASVLLNLAFQDGCTKDVTIELRHEWSGWLISRITSESPPRSGCWGCRAAPRKKRHIPGQTL